MLADYNITKDRQQQRTEGIYNIRTSYLNNQYSNEFEKRQAEFAYYRQTNRFLPDMSDTRKKRLIQQLNNIQ